MNKALKRLDRAQQESRTARMGWKIEACLSRAVLVCEISGSRWSGSAKADVLNPADNAPGTPSSTTNPMNPQNQQRRPTNPNQAAFAAHFLNSLRQFVAAKSLSVPPNLFITEPADPEVQGSTPTPPGVIDVFGKKVDLFRLYFTVIQMGGYAKVSHLILIGWARLLGLMVSFARSTGRDDRRMGQTGSCLGIPALPA